MPFSPISTPIATPEQASPYANLLKNMIAQYQESVKARYAQPMAEQGLQEAILKNKWNPEIWQSEIGLRGAQAREASAHAGLLGTETGINQLKLNYLRQRLNQGGQASQGGGVTIPNAYQQGSTPLTGGESGGNGGGAGGEGSNLTYSPRHGAQLQNPGWQGGMSENEIAGGQGSSVTHAIGTNGAFANPTPESMAGTGGGNAGTALEGYNPSAQGQEDQQPSGQAYGIEKPQMTNEDITNKMLLGVDSYSPKLQNAMTQQQQQYTDYQKEIAESVQEATAAQNMNQSMAVFNQAMDGTTYKGSYLGEIPSSGIHTAIMGHKNVDAAQKADIAITKMLPSAISTLKDAMGNARFSNLDMQMASNMKFSRTMNDKTRRTQTAWLKAVDDRMIEKRKFMQMMGNPKKGVQKTQADSLWQDYQNEFPLIDESGNTVMRQNLGNWPLFTTQKAINAIKRNGTFEPTRADRERFWMEVPNRKGGSAILPVKQGMIEMTLYKGGRPV